MVITAVTYIPVNGSRLAFPLYALHLDAPAYAVGLIAALLWVFPLLISWPVGLLADRHGTRWLLFGGTLCGIASMLTPWLFASLPAVFVAAALAGLWNAIYHVLTLSLMGTLSRPEKRAQSFVWYSMIGSLTNFSGPLFTGFAIEHAGYATTFLLLALPPVLVAVLLLAKGGLLPGGQPRATTRPSIRALLQDRTLLRLLAIGACVQLAIDLFPFLMPLYGHSIGLSPGAIGSVVSVIYISSLLMQLITPRTVARHGDARTLTVAFVAMAASFAFVPLTGGALALGAVACLFGFSSGSGQPVTTTMLFNHAGKTHPGEALGLRLTVNNVVRVLTPALMGTLGSLFGLAAICWVAGGALLGGSALSRAHEVTIRPPPPGWRNW